MYVYVKYPNSQGDLRGRLTGNDRKIEVEIGLESMVCMEYEVGGVFLRWLCHQHRGNINPVMQIMQMHNIPIGQCHKKKAKSIVVALLHRQMRLNSFSLNQECNYYYY